VNVSLNNWRLSARILTAFSLDRPIASSGFIGQRSGHSNVANLTFGAVIKGAGFTNASTTNLVLPRRRLRTSFLSIR